MPRNIYPAFRIVEVNFRRRVSQQLYIHAHIVTESPMYIDRHERMNELNMYMLHTALDCTCILEAATGILGSPGCLNCFGLPLTATRSFWLLLTPRACSWHSRCSRLLLAALGCSWLLHPFFFLSATSYSRLLQAAPSCSRKFLTTPRWYWYILAEPGCS